jgi:hypothetical protein
MIGWHRNGTLDRVQRKCSPGGGTLGRLLVVIGIFCRPVFDQCQKLWGPRGNSKIRDLALLSYPSQTSPTDSTLLVHNNFSMQHVLMALALI